MELGFKIEGPSLMCVDNLACIYIINDKKPTSRTRHIEVQLFAIQLWPENGEIIMRHIPGVINACDGEGDNPSSSVSSSVSIAEGDATTTPATIDEASISTSTAHLSSIDQHE
jgi:hypothetical protein